VRIYTRTGDTGQTGLIGGERVPKGCARVEAYGTVDELNAHLGLARALLQDAELDALLTDIQNELFDLGADLAASQPGAAPLKHSVPRITPAQVAALEAMIDRLEADLPPLQQFILPGGAPAGAALHVARCVCRRAERCTARLAAAEPVNPETLRYLNRLSDLLFVMARAANARQGVPEVPRRGGS
jgi:cob(I)alamin adenosyltransferase